MKNIEVVSSSNNSTKLIIQGNEFNMTDNDIKSLYNKLGQYLLRKEALK